MKNFRIYFLYISFILFLLLFFTKPYYIQKFALSIEDIKYSFRTFLNKDPEPSNKVVVVAVDEKSINEFGRWPWDRKIFGDLIRKLKDAKLIGLDIIFSEPTNPDSDKYLANSIKYAGNVVSGFFFRIESTQYPTEKIIDYLENCSIKRYRLLSSNIGLKEFPYIESNIPEILENSLSCAFFNIEPDIDGIYRQYPIAYLFKGLIFPSLSIQLYRLDTNKDIYLEIGSYGIVNSKIGDLKLKGNYINLNYYKNYKYISAFDVLKGNIDKDFFKNKIVLIGVTEIGVFDLRPTPIDPVLAGIYIHFTALSNLINKDFLKLNPFKDIIFALFYLIAVFFISFLRRTDFRLFLYLLIISMPFFISTYYFVYKNEIISIFYPLLSIFVFILGVEIYNYVVLEIRAKKIKNAFSKYVSPEIVEKISKNPDKLKLGGEEKEISVLFSDIRDFTKITESLTPKQVAKLLNIYLEEMTDIVLKNNGFLDKYIGDALMVLFNVVLTQPNHQDIACKTAINMIKKLKTINKKLKKENLPPINIGIGINSGKAVVGNLGSSFRFEYTAIGDTINLASRIEGLNRFYKTQILVSQYTKEKTTKKFPFRLIDKVKVKGKSEAIFIYEIMEKENRDLIDKYEEAFNLYIEKRFEEAKIIFESLWKKYRDYPSLILMERIKIYLKNPPEKWDGSYEFRKK